MTSLFIIDDEMYRHTVFSALAERLDRDFMGSYEEPQLRALATPISEDDATTMARQSLSGEFIWSLFTNPAKNAVILLDLVFEYAETTEGDRRTDLHQRLIDESTRGDLIAKKLVDILEEAQQSSNIFKKHYTAAFVAALASIKGWRVLLISRNATLDAPKPFITRLGCVTTPNDDLASLVSRLNEIPINGALFGRSQDECAVMLAEWYAALLQLQPHKDPLVSQILSIYSSPDDTGRNQVWSHTNCKDEGYRKRASQMLGMDEPCKTETTKSFFVQSSNGMSYGWEEDAYSCSKDTLGKVLNKIGLNCKIEAPYIQFPCNPGIAFLLSLKELQNEMASQANGEAPCFVFGALEDQHQQGVSYCVSCDLCTHHMEHQLEHFTRFMEKTFHGSRSEMTPPNLGSVCSKIWNVCHARLEDFHAHAANSTLALLRSGTPGFVAWPCFEPCKLVFRWRAYVALRIP